MGKTALVIRLGAYGDIIWAGSVFRALKKDGYHVTANVSEISYPVVEHNPNIDDFIIHETGSVPDAALDDYWEEIGCGFDRVINLSGSIEEALLKREGSEEFNWPHEKRHAECNVNYYDQTMKWAGYGIRGERGDIHFPPHIERWAKDFRKKHKGRFLVLWALSGSSYHKAYPYSEIVAQDFLNTFGDALVATVGGAFEEALEWSHPRTKCYSGKMPVLKAMALTKYADLVVGPETGVMSAAGCFDTPKIVMLSHSSEENLTKYWQNATSLHPKAECHPCHRLIYSLDACPWDMDLYIKSGIRIPKCAGKLNPQDVTNAMVREYMKWKGVDGTFHRHRESAVLCA